MTNFSKTKDIATTTSNSETGEVPEQILKSDILSQYMKTRILPVKFIQQGYNEPQTGPKFHTDKPLCEMSGYPEPPRLKYKNVASKNTVINLNFDNLSQSNDLPTVKSHTAGITYGHLGLEPTVNFKEDQR